MQLLRSREALRVSTENSTGRKLVFLCELVVSGCFVKLTLKVMFGAIMGERRPVRDSPLWANLCLKAHTHMHELRAREVALARDVEALTERVAMALGGAPFAVMPIDGKGFGVVATRDLFIGERLLAETPLLVVPMDVSGYDGQRNGEYEGIPSALLEAAVDALPADSRCKFFELSQNSAYGVTRSPAGIAQTNGIPHTHGSKTYGAIYYTGESLQS